MGFRPCYPLRQEDNYIEFYYIVQNLKTLIVAITDLQGVFELWMFDADYLI
ncbi:15971_t:CDS:1, partial [Dentiscutata erythropus]